MPQNNFHDDDDSDKNAAYRSGRRTARSTRAKRNSGRAGRGQRRIVVHSQRREQPDVRKIARAVIAIAMADAEREAKAQADVPEEPSDEQ